MTIFLIGMPGSGKSTIGKQLAEKLQIPFFDTDEIISSLEEMSISEIFNTYGELHFRKLEADLITNWKLHNAVIATGGGLPCNDELMSHLNNLGLTIWLKVSTAALEQRLEAEIETRPLLNQDGKLLPWIKSTLKERTPYYNQAKTRINATESPEVITNRILRKLYA